MQDPALRSRLEQAVGEVRCSPVKRPPAASELTNLVKGIDGRIAGPDAAADAMGRMALDASLAVLRGERPAHLVNPDAYTGRKRAG
jgi:hypothetical protein